MRKLIYILLQVFTIIPFWAGAAIQRPCDGAQKDNDIWWSGIQHDSFLEDFRKPFGAVPAASGEVRLRFQSCANDISAVRLVVWDAVKRERNFYPMQSVAQKESSDFGPLEAWEIRLQIPREATILYYFFELRDGRDVDFFVDDDPRHFPGGAGSMVEEWDDSRSFQVTVYDPRFEVSEAIQGKIAYQIFPDRFKNGRRDNDVSQENRRWVYGQDARALQWNEKLCDPYSSECPHEKYNLYYGGDLEGIRQKIPYLNSLGVEILYLNPIFSSPTNHRYDSSDPFQIDPLLGSNQEFQDLVVEARNAGIQIILDGVFNHLSSDSPYFDLWSRWNERGELISPRGPGSNDGSGACESSQSPYRSWFYIPDIGNPAWNRSANAAYRCPQTAVAGSLEFPQTFEAWFGLFNVPKINVQNPEVQDWIMGAHDRSLLGHWAKEGIAGWRLDVGGDIDPGHSRDPWNSFWESFRHRQKSLNPESWIVGEEWGNPSPWLLGNEWDSAMNYSLRSSLLRWVYDSCRGEGCDLGGRIFRDNDSNEGSPLGPLYPISESLFARQVTGVQEWLPPEAFHSMMNLLGSHDTNRILFLLEKISGENREVALRKLQFLYSFLFAYPGVPTVYYGDEVAINAGGRWVNGQWIDDPYNRATYPWPEDGMEGNEEILSFVSRLGQLRKNHSALSRGDLRFLQLDDEKRVITFLRTHQTSGSMEQILVVMNRSSGRLDDYSIKVGNLAASGRKVWRDLFSGRSFSEFEGKIEINGVQGLSALYLKQEN